MYFICIWFTTSASISGNTNLFDLGSISAAAQCFLISKFGGGGSYLGYKYANSQKWRNGDDTAMPAGNYMATGSFYV